MLKLYGYWRSSAAYRVRIALNLKGLDYEQVSVNIAPAASAQKEAGFAELNPQMRVPVLETDAGRLTQSMAILEWLEEMWPKPALLPGEPFERAACRAFADTVACDIHPLNNLSVLVALREDFGASPEAVSRWYGDWILRGFAALETMASERRGAFLFGGAPGLAEVCLVPQIYNAGRFEVDLSAFPRLLEINAACAEHSAFIAAAPDNQPDAV